MSVAATLSGLPSRATAEVAQETLERANAELRMDAIGLLSRLEDDKAIATLKEAAECHDAEPSYVIRGRILAIRDGKSVRDFARRLLEDQGD